MRLGALCIAAVLTAFAGPVAAEKKEDSTTAARAVRPKQPSVTVAAIGDVLFGRYIKSPKKLKRVARVEHPFDDVKPLISAADIAFLNVETPVMDEPAKFTVFQTLTFRAEVSDAEELADVGFDVASIANNHTLNLGYGGAAATRKNVSASGIDPCGAGVDEEEAFEPVIKQVNGVRVMFLCVTVWTNGRKEKGKGGAVAYVGDRVVRKEMPELIKKARKAHNPDFTVVSIHWGFEYESSARNDQKRAARDMVKAGADLILGHHAHVMQEFETYEGAFIAYSMGNFLFDNPKQDQRETVIIEANFSGEGEDRNVDVTLHPVWIERSKADGSVPKLATGSNYKRIQRRLKKLAPGIAVAPDPSL